MRTYGRFNGEWVEIDTDANGLNDAVYAVTLIQTLLLVTGESPFYANYGIPAPQSVASQTLPDAYVMQIQQQFAPYFASLFIQRTATSPTPTYAISALSHTGAIFNTQIRGSV